MIRDSFVDVLKSTVHGRSLLGTITCQIINFGRGTLGQLIVVAPMGGLPPTVKIPWLLEMYNIYLL